MCLPSINKVDYYYYYYYHLRRAAIESSAWWNSISKCSCSCNSPYIFHKYPSNFVLDSVKFLCIVLQTEGRLKKEENRELRDTVLI